MKLDIEARVIKAVRTMLTDAMNGFSVSDGDIIGEFATIIDALPAPEALPIAWMAEHEDDSKDFVNFYEDVCRQQAEDSGAHRVIPLYAAPEALSAAKGELSDAEIEAVWNGLGYRTKYTAYLRDFARAILAKAKDQS